MALTVCRKCKGLSRTQHVGVGVLVVSIAIIALLLWLFLASNEKLFGGAGSGSGGAQSPETGNTKPEVFAAGSRNTTYPRLDVPVERLTIRERLYVGVMTMERYIGTRAAVCNETWGRSPEISRLEFFATLPSDHAMAGLPDVINMQDVSTSPTSAARHVDETFTMLQHVCDTHLDRYDWFVRAVDDAYLRPQKLLQALAYVDKRKKVYMGHPASMAAEGAKEEDKLYCLGGPGIVFSRRTLKGLCPHLQRCKKHFRQGNADEVLGRCVHKHLGLQCTKSPKMKEYFFNTYERNVVALFEAASRRHDAVALHPLKTPWMMRALHQRHLQRQLRALKQNVDETRSRLERLRSYSKANHSHGSSGHVHSDRWFVSTATERTTRPGLVLSASGTQFNSRGCQPRANVSTALNHELNAAIALSNSSCRWGNMINCHTFLGSAYYTSPVDTSYSVHLQCSDLRHNKSASLTTVRLTKAFLTPKVTRRRERALGSKLVALLPVVYSDPGMLHFLFMWKNLLHHKYIDDFLLVLLIIEPPEMHHRNQSRTQGGYPEVRVENTLKDLMRWSTENLLHVRTYYLNKTTRHHKVQKKILNELKEENENSVILFAKPNLNFDERFLYKCRVFVRPGKQIYRPYALRSRKPVHDTEIPDFMWTSSGSPLCIHLSDLMSINYKRRPKTSGSKQAKPIKIIHSHDDTVEIQRF